MVILIKLSLHIIIILNFACYFIANMNGKIPYIIAVFILLANTLFANTPIAKLNAGKPWNNAPSVHPVHISYTNIEYNDTTGKFEILFKFFVDDFDLILKAKYGKEMNLAGGRWEKSYPTVINQYILEHFKLLIDGKDKTKGSLKYLRNQVNDKSIWLYYDFNARVKSNKFEVHNSFMTDLYYDQHNLLIFTYLNQQKAIKLDFTNRVETFSF